MESMLIEVERKFTPLPSTKGKLLEALRSTSTADDELTGNSVISRKHMKDMYYDDAELSLTKADKWLRRRDGEWQLKLPPQTPQTVKDGLSSSSGGTNVEGSKNGTQTPALHSNSTFVYQEVTGADNVWSTLDRPQKESGLVPFAFMETYRTTFHFTWRGHNLQVVLDECIGHDPGATTPAAKSGGVGDTSSSLPQEPQTARAESTDTLPRAEQREFHYLVGEIEVLVDDTSKVDRAREDIDAFCTRYNIAARTGSGSANSNTAVSPGKLVAYLKVVRPMHFRTLRDLGVISM